MSVWMCLCLFGVLNVPCCCWDLCVGGWVKCDTGDPLLGDYSCCSLDGAVVVFILASSGTQNPVSASPSPPDAEANGAHPPADGFGWASRRLPKWSALRGDGGTTARPDNRTRSCISEGCCQWPRYSACRSANAVPAIGQPGPASGALGVQHQFPWALCVGNPGVAQVLPGRGRADECPIGSLLLTESADSSTGARPQPLP